MTALGHHGCGHAFLTHWTVSGLMCQGCEKEKLTSKLKSSREEKTLKNNNNMKKNQISSLMGVEVPIHSHHFIGSNSFLCSVCTLPFLPEQFFCVCPVSDTVSATRNIINK